MAYHPDRPHRAPVKKALSFLLALAAAFSLSACEDFSITIPLPGPPSSRESAPASSAAGSPASLPDGSGSSTPEPSPELPTESDGASGKRESSAPEAPAAPGGTLRDGASGYGRSTLSPKLQAAYDALAEGIWNFSERVPLSLSNAEELSQVLLCIRRDYPVISWMDNRYTYEASDSRGVTSIYLKYTKTREAASSELASVQAAARALIANIDSGLSDFDKALIVFDRLCGHVDYDLKAPRKDDAYGALCDARATCDGYAKAYQYALSLLGMEALVVYGEAGEPHAWNIVRLGAGYYQADPTWGDAFLSDGDSFLSHEFLFLDDETFSRSHTPYGGEHNYPLPACDSMDENYFVQKGTVLDAADSGAFAECLQNALDQALANRYDAVQIRFATPELADRCQALYIDSAKADQLIQKKAASRGRKAVGRSYSKAADVLTYLIE